MEISVTADDLFDEYKQQIAHLNHELILEKVKNRKMAEKLQEFQRAEADRVHTMRQQAVQVPTKPLAAPQNAGDGPTLRRLSVEAPEPPPLPPGPDSGPSRT